MEELDSLYKEIMLEHHKDPRNFGEIDQPDVRREGFNPLCGDRIVLDLKFNSAQTRIDEAAFSGEGCSICMASASMMMEEIERRERAEVESCLADFRAMMKGEKSPDDFDSDIAALAGVRKFAVRIKCALLPWTTLGEALAPEQEVSERSSTE